MLGPRSKRRAGHLGAVGNDHFCDTTERASQRLFSSYTGGFPCITEVGRNPLIPQPLDNSARNRPTWTRQGSSLVAGKTLGPVSKGNTAAVLGSLPHRKTDQRNRDAPKGAGAPATASWAAPGKRWPAWGNPRTFATSHRVDGPNKKTTPGWVPFCFCETSPPNKEKHILRCTGMFQDVIGARGLEN